MPKPLAHYTELARRDVDPSIVAAVPARSAIVRPEDADVVIGGAVWFYAVRVIGGFGRLLVRMVRSEATAAEQAQFFKTVLAFHPDRMTVHRRRIISRRLGPEIDRRRFKGVKYERLTTASQTRLRIDLTEWVILGWYERDLSAALRTLGLVDPMETR